ncbi:hypothetical protein G3A49_13440 [Haloferax volcanii]|uniref:Uncharacterized protein n=1 Tax=Haloferax volcanii TaxID=2246 RepID=A0A6C0UV65_HALVO|nr:hypothetical protein [Haloferax alexandrinus]QIB79080.1 hypothetical protein G3A49_13440 [Haloferax alexandrinus]
MTEVDGESGSRSSFTRSSPDGDYSGEFAAVLHGFKDEFDARGYEINSEIGYNRFHLQSYYSESMDHPCYDGSIGDITGDYYRVDFPDSSSTFDRHEPDRRDLNSDDTLNIPLNATFGVNYSPVPFFSATVGTSIELGYNDNSTITPDDYSKLEYDISGGTYADSQVDSGGVKFDIVDDGADPHDNVKVYCTAQQDYKWLCNRTYNYNSTPELYWAAFINVI